MFRTFGAEAESLVEENRPKREELIAASDGFRFALAVCSRGHIFMFVSQQRPELPAAQPLAMTQVKEGIKVIVRDRLLLARLAVKRKHDKTNLVPKKPVLQTPVKRNHGRVVQAGVRRALLKINRKQGEPLLGVLLLVLSPRKAEHLKELKAI